jgi:hypothetical protein
MVMQERLDWLLNCGRPWAEHRARTAMAMIAAHDAGEITLSEFQELMQDLARSDTLNAEADDAEIKNLLVSCIMIGAKLA